MARTLTVRGGRAVPSTPHPSVRRVALAAAAATALLAGCGTSAARDIDAVPAAAQRTFATAAPTAAAAERSSQPDDGASAGPDAATALDRAASWAGTATYALRATSGTTATVTVTRSTSRVRVDVATGKQTSSLMSADAGWVACASTDRTTCVLVAAAGKPVPAAFDPGVGRLFTTALPQLATRASGLYPSGYLVASGDVPAAACVEVVAPDTGRYCVTEQGVLRRAKFPGGTLDLVSVSNAVDAARLVPPVTPTPLG
jgi:hypothetical protein